MNLVPVDFASKAIVQIGQLYKPTGNNFHIVNDQNIQWLSIVEELAKFKVPGTRFEIPIHPDEWWNYVQLQIKEAQTVTRREVLSGLLLFPNGIPNEETYVNADNTENYLNGKTLVSMLIFSGCKSCWNSNPPWVFKLLYCCIPRTVIWTLENSLDKLAQNKLFSN